MLGTFRIHQVVIACACDAQLTITTHSDKGKGYKGFELWIDGAIVGQMLMDQPPTREQARPALVRVRSCTQSHACVFSAANTDTEYLKIQEAHQCARLTVRCISC